MSKNIAAASKALETELAAGRVEQDNIAGYLASIDVLIEQAREVKKLYAKEIAVAASRKSRAKKAEELAAMKARLAELEASTK